MDIVTSSTTIDNNYDVIINESSVKVDNSTSGYMEVIPDEYVLSSTGIYSGGNFTGEVPEWLKQAIQVELATGDGNLTDIVNDLATLVNTLSNDIQQNSQALASYATTTDTSISILNSKVDNNQSTVLNELSTKITADEAKSISEENMSDVFGPNPIVTVNNIAASYVGSDSAVAVDMQLITDLLNETTTTASDQSEAIDAINAELDTIPTLVKTNELQVIADGTTDNTGPIQLLDTTENTFTGTDVDYTVETIVFTSTSTDTGFNVTRMCNISQTFEVVSYFTPTLVDSAMTGTLQKSVDGGAWEDIEGISVFSSADEVVTATVHTSVLVDGTKSVAFRISGNFKSSSTDDATLKCKLIAKSINN